MIEVVLKRAVEEYFSNFKVMLSFGVMFLFLALFALFDQFFFGSGSVFFSLNSNLIGGIVGIVISLVFLYFFSFFVSLTVYAAHRDVQHISFDSYWNDLFKDAAIKIFFFYLILAVLFYAISSVGFVYGFAFWALVLNMLIGLIVLFVPQSIVLDQTSVLEAIGRSIEFWSNNFLVSLAIFAIATVALFVITLIELVLQMFNLPGVAVSFFLVLVVLVPFFEQTKSYAYLMNNALLKSNEVVHAHAPRIEKPKPMYGVRLREQPKKGSKI
jgi:hypothetical protein